MQCVFVMQVVKHYFPKAAACFSTAATVLPVSLEAMPDLGL